MTWGILMTINERQRCQTLKKFERSIWIDDYLIIANQPNITVITAHCDVAAAPSSSPRLRGCG